MYGNSGELHETAFKFNGTVPSVTVVSGTGTLKQKTLAGNSIAIQYTTIGQTVVEVGSNILLYILGMCCKLRLSVYLFLSRCDF